MAARFDPAPNFDDIIRGATVDGRREAAELVVKAAERAAPERSGNYRRSLRVAVDGLQVRAETTDPFGHLVEFGSVNNPPYSPLRRGAAEVGRLDEAPK